MSLDEVAIGTVGRNAYRIRFWGMTKVEAVNRMKKC